MSMRRVAIIFGMALAATAAPRPAHAQTWDRPVATRDQLQGVADELGPVLRFRQLGDTNTVGKGDAEVAASWSDMPAVSARFGVAERADFGGWAAFQRNGQYGVLGVDTKVILAREGTGLPVSIAVRPSITALVGASNLWAASAAVDVSISRAFGPLSPYGGLAASSTAAFARSSRLGLEPETAGQTYAFAGIAYRWRAMILAGEVEDGTSVNYAFRVGTRF